MADVDALEQRAPVTLDRPGGSAQVSVAEILEELAQRRRGPGGPLRPSPSRPARALAVVACSVRRTLADKDF